MKSYLWVFAAVRIIHINYIITQITEFTVNNNRIFHLTFPLPMLSSSSKCSDTDESLDEEKKVKLERCETSPPLAYSPAHSPPPTVLCSNLILHNFIEPVTFVRCSSTALIVVGHCGTRMLYDCLNIPIYIYNYIYINQHGDAVDVTRDLIRSQ